jgi:hypothetical protein
MDQRGDYADPDLPPPRWPTLGQLVVVGAVVAATVALPIAFLYFRFSW